MTMSKMSLEDAAKMDRKDLRDEVTNTKINKISIDGYDFEINGQTWSNFVIKIAEWIHKEKGLKLPLYNHAEEKLFLCEKESEFGRWKTRKGFCIDTKYAASEHILNAVHICKAHDISRSRIEFEYEKNAKNAQ